MEVKGMNKINNKRKGRTLEEMLELNAKGLTDIAEHKVMMEKRKQVCSDCKHEFEPKLS